jgi:hypothetical protein
LQLISRTHLTCLREFRGTGPCRQGGPVAAPTGLRPD